MKSPMRYSRRLLKKVEEGRRRRMVMWRRVVPGIEGVRCGPSRRWDQRPGCVRWARGRRPDSRGCAPAPRMWPRSRWLTSRRRSWRPTASGASIRRWGCWWKSGPVPGCWPTVSSIQSGPSGRRTKAAGSSWHQQRTTGTPTSRRKNKSTYPPPFFFFLLLLFPFVSAKIW